MVRAYHLIISAYGFWLPNDPRGSWSDWIRKWKLLRFGPPTKTKSRRSVAGREHDVATRMAAKEVLEFPPVAFSGQQALAVAEGFAEACRKSEFVVWACAVLPEHVHLVIARHRLRIEQISNLLKGQASKSLLSKSLHPFGEHRDEKTGKTPSCWSRGQWKVFLNEDRDIRRAIEYVVHNPVKEGKREQRWSFVTPFEG